MNHASAELAFKAALVRPVPGSCVPQAPFFCGREGEVFTVISFGIFVPSITTTEVLLHSAADAPSSAEHQRNVADSPAVSMLAS
jgi:hypothetical protein